MCLVHTCINTRALRITEGRLFASAKLIPASGCIRCKQLLTWFSRRQKHVSTVNMGKNVSTSHLWMFTWTSTQICCFFLHQSKLPFTVWGFLYWAVCSCTSHLFGIPQLSSLCLPCFRPRAWLTCPSSSEWLNTAPPWNHQLQSSDLPGPVCFSMKLPPDSLAIHVCLMHLRCRVVMSLPPQDVPRQYHWSWHPLICWQLK